MTTRMTTPGLMTAAELREFAVVMRDLGIYKVRLEGGVTIEMSQPALMAAQGRTHLPVTSTDGDPEEGESGTPPRRPPTDEEMLYAHTEGLPE
jgi:hypothetical protein